MKLRDRAGDVCGRLYVTGRGPAIVQNNGRKRVQWVCVCECGNELLVEAGNLNSGHTKSCGCLSEDACAVVGGLHDHGMTGSREFQSWSGAKGRCYNPDSQQYKNYGGRGITMHPDWIDNFQEFYDHIGPCPAGLTLDRMDNNKGYIPGNVRWATSVEQIRNRRVSIVVEYKGRTEHLAVFAEEVGLPYTTVYERVVRQGWSIEKSLTTKIRKRK